MSAAFTPHPWAHVVRRCLVGALLVLLLVPGVPASAASVDAALVAIVKGDILGPGGQAMAGRAQRFADATAEALQAARVPYLVTTDSAVQEHGMPPVAVAVLPYNRAVTDRQLQQLEGFIQDGGKLIVCYVGRRELLRHLGVVAGDFVRGAPPGRFAGIDFDARDIAGLPPIVRQYTAEIRTVSPTACGRIIARWQDTDGNEVGQPAVILGPGGAYLNFPLLPGQAQAKGAMLRALIAHFAPGVWRQAVPASAAELGPVGPYRSLAALLDVLGRTKAPTRRRALHQALQAASTLGAARKLLEEGRLQEAVAMADKAHRQAVEAHWMSYQSLPGELRGCWAGPMPQPDWDTAMRNLAAANFNAVFPYFVSAGTAFYNSTILPKNTRCGDADPLAAAVSAAHEHGIKLHARMLNLQALFADRAIIQAYKSQHRAMVSASGEPTDWLCPSNPKNRDLQVRLAVELVTKYRVDGLQLDYMRYPGSDYCYCAGCRRRFEQQAGVHVEKWPDDVQPAGRYGSQFDAWRRQQIDDLVRDIATAVRGARPGLPLSAAVFVRWDLHRHSFGQDWVNWLRQGWVDFVCPMDYTSDMDTFRQWVSLQGEWIGDLAPWAVGIGPFATNTTLDVQAVADQIQIARRLGARGFVIFNYRPALALDYLPYLALGLTARPAIFDWQK